MRNLRYEISTKQVLDLVESIQKRVEDLCPFGSMIKVMYKVDTGIKNDQWMVTNR